MDKLKMAHELLVSALKGGVHLGSDHAGTAQYFFDLADAMQVEADKRSISLTKDKDGNCLHFHHEFGHKKCMDCGASLDEWQPDWSQAPKWAKWWAFDGCNKKANWYANQPYIDDGSMDEDDWNVKIKIGKVTFIEAPTFDYTGNWQDSLRKRPTT